MRSRIESPEGFESEDLSVVNDYDACFRSRYFMLIYPQKIASSALIELGWAMGSQEADCESSRRNGTSFPSWQRTPIASLEMSGSMSTRRVRTSPIGSR